MFNTGIGNEVSNLNFYKNNNTGTSSFLEPNDFHKAHLARKYEKIDEIALYIFSIKFTDCLDFDLSVLIKTSIFINYQNIRYHE